MASSGSKASPAGIDWDNLLPGAELSASVLMASGFALGDGPRPRERYRIERRLGEGGMGQVLAVSLQGSSEDQLFAVKVVARTYANEETSDPELGDADQQARSFAELLRAEAAKQEVAARQGVNVARLFALVQFDDGSLGLRMELARGHSLESQITKERKHKNRAPDVGSAVRVVRKLLGQLRRLHEMARADSPFGFVHSDIKPGNVFVDDTDPTDVNVTLLDFGVATAGQALAHSLATMHTRRKTLVLDHAGGTLGYVPPGHFAGQVTPLSDVYATLVILFELCTLSLPWDRASFASSRPSIAEVEGAMLKGPRAVREVRPGISEAMSVALDTFFQKEFGELNDLATQVVQSGASGDAEAQRRLFERLRGLARDYQSRLDELHAGVAPTHLVASASAGNTGRLTVPGDVRPSLVEPRASSAGATPHPRPSSDPRPRGPNTEHGVMRGDAEEWTGAPTMNPVRRAGGGGGMTLGPGAGGKEEFTWNEVPGARRGEEEEPPEVPMRSFRALWIVLALLAVGGAGGGYYWFVVRPGARAQNPPPVDHRAQTTADAGATPTSADAAVASVAADGAAARSDAGPSVALADARAPVVAAVVDAGAAVPSADAATGPGTMAAGAHDAGGRATPGGGTQGGTGNNTAGTTPGGTAPGGAAGAAAGHRVRCVGPARGVSVVASGGAMMAPVTVCTTRNAIPATPWLYAGYGAIPQTVEDASPSYACHGGEGLELRRVNLGGAVRTLFECEGPGGSGGGGGGN